MNFITKLSTAQQTNRSWICVGLDPVLEKLPDVVRNTGNPLLTFGRAIVEATADLVCAFKPNLAFWLAEGQEGLSALQAVVAAIPDHIPVILDGKFNDIGHTAAAYARFAFEAIGADGVTANPYLGIDGVRPFIAESAHAAFLLARTSNPSAPDVQDKLVDDHPLYEEIARLAVHWDIENPGVCGLVVGATYPQELARLRELAPSLVFLIPGVGAQGGSVEAAVTYGPTAEGLGPVINSSREILYASSGPDFAQAARAAALTLRDRINQTQEAT